MTENQRSYWSDVLMGSCVGAFLGVFLAITATVIAVVNPEALHRDEITLPQVVLLYLISGPVGGAIFGALRPILGRLIGRIFACVLVMIPFTFMLSLVTQEGFEKLSFWGHVFLGVFLGVGYGVCWTIYDRFGWLGRDEKPK